VNPDTILALPSLLLGRLDVAWTVLLLMARFGAFFTFVPGLGGGITGFMIRYPGVMAISLVSLDPRNPTAVPNDPVMMAAQVASEVFLGTLTALVPLMIVSGAQVAGGLASGAMGLNGAQLIDPSTQSQMPDLARIYSDLSILIFLLIGGHHVAIAQLAGLDSSLAPGSFVISGAGIGALVDQGGQIFRSGCLLAAPVIAALLLTNFVMGVISKAVPTVNIFIVSFPITVSIGLILSIVALPEMSVYLTNQFLEIERLLALVTAR
jgi:flagellar biosynthetic protein FliR